MAASSIDLSLLPSYAPGVRLLEGFDNSGKFFIGTPRSGLIFYPPHALTLLRNIDGTTSIRDLLSQREVPETPANGSTTERSSVAGIFIRTLEELRQGNYVELRAPVDHKKFLSQSDRNLLARIIPESTLAYWRKSDSTPTLSADEIVLHRAHFPILLFGSKRLAFTLFSLLLASGFSQTKILAGDRAQASAGSDSLKRQKISPVDIAGLSIRMGDVGLPKSDCAQLIARESNLIPIGDENFPKIPALIVTTEIPQPDFLQRWMSEGVPHLQISHLYESSIEVGPIVIPGKTPCLRCIALHKHGEDPLRNRIEISATLDCAPELSAGAAAFIAGHILLQIISFADTGDSELLGKTVRHNLFSPCNPEHIYWQPHSFCGCYEVV